MDDESVIGAAREEFQPTLNITTLYEHYLPIAAEAFAGGLSSVEQEILHQVIAKAVVGKTIGEFEKIRESVELVIDLAKRRPLSRQIADLEERFVQDERHIRISPIPYMAGTLITDKLYPGGPKEYGGLEFTGQGAVNSGEERSNLFVEIGRNNRRQIVPIPVLETEPTWRQPHYQWHITTQLSDSTRRIEDPRLISNKIFGLLVYRGGRSSEYKPTFERDQDTGKWNVGLDFKAGSAAARNVERVARAFAKCDTYQVTRIQEPPRSRSVTVI